MYPNAWFSCNARRSWVRRTTAGPIAAVAMVVLLQMVAMPEAGAAPGDLTLASTSSGGTKGTAGSFRPAVSADGSKVAFYSVASNLDPADPDGIQDVYVKDLASGTLALASTSSDGIKGNAQSFDPSISADGTKIAFITLASNLDPSDTDILQDVYVKDLVSGSLTLASSSSDGTKADNHSFGPSLSADGTKVAFSSGASNLHPGDSDAVEDVYVKDLVSGALTLASTRSDGGKGNQHSVEASLSADGTRVAFGSFAANLDPSDTDPLSDVYVKDLVSGMLSLASTSSGGTKGAHPSTEPSISGDGSKVAFQSQALNLVPGDFNESLDVFVKDLVSGTLTLASMRADTHTGNSHSQMPSLSADGTKVAFDTLASNLDPNDPDHGLDVYVKDLVSGTLTLASTSSSGAKGNLSSIEASLSANGSKVAFQSQASNLAPGDSDTSTDIYVKELTGGDPEPEPITVSIKIKKSGSTYTTTVITTPDFDAAAINVGTVCFGDAEAPVERDCTELDGAGQLKDADRDGDLDMLLQFEAVQTGIDAGDTQACLTGETTGGTPIQGCGAVKVR
jgi:Tol biopolymer transport system component